MKYNELYQEICKVVPEALALSWDNDGKMLCLEKDKDIKKILVCLDVTLDAIEYAGKNHFDLIVSHHPLIFKPILTFTCDTISTKRMAYLINYGVSVISLHTRLDVTYVNAALATALELEDIEEFSVEGSPMGRMGSLKKEMNASQFAEYLKKKLGSPCVEYSDIDGYIKRVAVLGGSGADAIKEAKKLGADCLVTGECGYNKMLDSAEDSFPIFTAGHFHTENPVCSNLVGILKGIDSTLECEIFNSNILKTV